MISQNKDQSQKTLNNRSNNKHWINNTRIYGILGHVSQSVTCLNADPGVVSLILTKSHTFAEIDHEIISTAILLSSADS